MHARLRKHTRNSDKRHIHLHTQTNTYTKVNCQSIINLHLGKVRTSMSANLSVHMYVWTVCAIITLLAVELTEMRVGWKFHYG